MGGAVIAISVLASHEGSTLQAVLDACAEGVIDGLVGLVLSNNSGSGALRRATVSGVSTRHLSGVTHPDANALDQAMLASLVEARTDVVLLAGYMKKLGPSTLTHYEGRILNTHPALLPRFGGQGMYGGRVHRAVLDAGETESGATVHLVDGAYDTGEIVAQRVVAVAADDTEQSLAARVQHAERELLVEVLSSLSRGLLKLAAQAARP
jgi:phosphoribosylglycinamide formyltransferase-1